MLVIAFIAWIIAIIGTLKLRSRHQLICVLVAVVVSVALAIGERQRGLIEGSIDTSVETIAAISTNVATTLWGSFTEWAESNQTCNEHLLGATNKSVDAYKSIRANAD
jgi:hypothetical protein